jgi:hypothetical protein
MDLAVSGRRSGAAGGRSIVDLPPLPPATQSLAIGATPGRGP